MGRRDAHKGRSIIMAYRKGFSRSHRPTLRSAIRRKALCKVWTSASENSRMMPTRSRASMLYRSIAYLTRCNGTSSRFAMSLAVNRVSPLIVLQFWRLNFRLILRGERIRAFARICWILWGNASADIRFVIRAASGCPQSALRCECLCLHLATIAARLSVGHTREDTASRCSY